jgi:hypothetical protein
MIECIISKYGSPCNFNYLLPNRQIFRQRINTDIYHDNDMYIKQNFSKVLDEYLISSLKTSIITFDDIWKLIGNYTVVMSPFLYNTFIHTYKLSGITNIYTSNILDNELIVITDLLYDIKYDKREVPGDFITSDYSVNLSIDLSGCIKYIVLKKGSPEYIQYIRDKKIDEILLKNQIN